MSETASLKVTYTIDELDSAWIPLLITQAISEILSAYIILVVIYLTYKIETIANSFFVHGSKLFIALFS